MKTVLIVDDSMYMRSLIESAFSQSGRYSVVGQAAFGNEAIELALELNPDVITMDNILPDILGVDVVKELRQENVASKIVMITAVGQDAVISECLASGADDFLIKPFTESDLLRKVDEFFK